jgi:hypothetical protein
VAPARRLLAGHRFHKSGPAPDALIHVVPYAHTDLNIYRHAGNGQTITLRVFKKA